MRKKGVLFLGIIASILCAADIKLYLDNQAIKNDIKKLDKRKELELKEKLTQERALLGKDLEEGHKSELAAFEEAYKSLNTEKKRTKALQEKLNKLDKKEPQDKK